MNDVLSENLRLKAIEHGTSLNITIKEVLSQALGILPEHKNETSPKRNGYSRFLGLWSAEDEKSFNEATADFSRIDAGDWQP